MTTSTDIHITNCGSILLFTGLTETGIDWIRRHLIEGNDEVQLWGPKHRPGVVVEPRYAPAIIDGIRDDGLEVS